MSIQIEDSAPTWGDLGRPAGSVLAELRRRRGLSVAELAARLGVSKSNLHRLEHGLDLRVSTLLDIARELGMEPMLIPKENVAAVRSLVSSLGSTRRSIDEADGGPRFG